MASQIDALSPIEQAIVRALVAALVKETHAHDVDTSTLKAETPAGRTR